MSYIHMYTSTNSTYMHMDGVNVETYNWRPSNTVNTSQL